MDEQDREGALHDLVLRAEEGKLDIEMGSRGPMLRARAGDWAWVLDDPKQSVPLIEEELIPRLETAGPKARKLAKQAHAILGRWRALQSGQKQEPTEAELKWLAKRVRIDPVNRSISVKSKDPDVVRRAAAIAEKILGTPQPISR